MIFCQVSLKRLRFIDIFKTGLYKCFMSFEKKKIKQKRCFACITLDNKVIKTVVEWVISAILCESIKSKKQIKAKK